MKRARLLEIERLRDEAQIGLVHLSVGDVWELVEELLPEAELASIIEAENGTLVAAWRDELAARQQRSRDARRAREAVPIPHRVKR